MAKFDPKKYGFHNLMHPEAGAVVYPNELKGDTWRKEKGKLCPETGIGKALDKCEAEFKKVNWQNFNATTIDKLDAEEVRLEKWCKGSEIKNFRDELLAVAELAKKKAAELKKAKLVPKASGEAAQAVHDAADWLTVTLNDATLKQFLKDAKEACRKVRLGAALKTAGLNIDAAKDVRAKLGSELQTIKKVLDDWTPTNEVKQRAAVGTALRDICRDMTQPLGNLVKAQLAGAGYVNFNQQAVATLFKDMSVISNTQGWSKSWDGFSKDQMEVEYNKIYAWANQFMNLTLRVAMP